MRQVGNLFIKKSNITGKGVFSQKAFKRGEKVFTFSHKKVEIKHRQGCNCRLCHRCIQVGKYLWLCPKKNSYGWNLNHSCNPTCGIKGNRIVAMQNIKPSEEITIDYGTSNNDAAWKLQCKCQSKNCRKVIQSVQFLSKSLRKKYRRFIHPFLRRSSLENGETITYRPFL